MSDQVPTSTPELNRQVIVRYLDDRVITQGRSLVLIGPAGLGKTHLAISLALAQLKRGYLVRFTTTQALLTRVLRAGGLDGRAKVLKPYIQSDLLVLDEFGYLPADPEIGARAARQRARRPPHASRRRLPPQGRELPDPRQGTHRPPAARHGHPLGERGGSFTKLMARFQCERPRVRGTLTMRIYRITTERPDVLWGTDATCFWTAQDGWCWFFGAIDHATDELVGWKATKRGDRWAALEPLYQGVRYAFGRVGKDVARGLSVRSDWGPQYTAHAFGAELRWLGIQHSPSFVGEPQCNGVIERFMRTLKEQCLWLHRFVDLAHAEREIGAFIERYNQEWLVERHGHCSPRAIRAKLKAAA